MKFAKLYKPNGLRIKQPVLIEGSVAFDSKTGIAQAFAADGKKLLAELQGSRVIWIGVAGLRLQGFEPIDLEARKMRAMEWQLVF